MVGWEVGYPIAPDTTAHPYNTTGYGVEVGTKILREAERGVGRSRRKEEKESR